MKYIQRLLLVQIVLIQSIFGYDYDSFGDHNNDRLLIHSEVYHCNDDCCYPVLIYTGSFDNSVNFNTKLQPEISNPQPKAVRAPPPVKRLIDPLYFPRNDDQWLKEPPRFFYDQPQSNVDYGSFDNKRPFVRSHRTPFALMSTKELAQHFAFLKYSQEQILDEYQLYLNDSFINFVKDFPEYEATLKKHC
jgi:hypothetical protein